MGNIYTRYNELNNNNNINCTAGELDEFICCGLLFKSKNGYLDRCSKNININLITEKNCKMNIDLSNLINICNNMTKDSKTKKVYCMSERCYNNYKNIGLIITENNKEYYRKYDKELWLVYKY